MYIFLYRDLLPTLLYSATWTKNKTKQTIFPISINDILHFVYVHIHICVSGTGHISLKALANEVATTVGEKAEVLDNRDKIVRMGELLSNRAATDSIHALLLHIRQ